MYLHFVEMDRSKWATCLFFFLFIEELIVTYRADDPKFNFQCMSHLQGLNCEFLLGRLSCHLRSLIEPPAAECVTMATEMSWYDKWKLWRSNIHWHTASSHSSRIIYVFPSLPNPQASLAHPKLSHLPFTEQSNMLANHFLVIISVSRIVVRPGQR